MDYRKFKNEVIKASAGSGKTFQLSNRYIHLLLSGIPADRILATTFTRKAAGEIFDRILCRLSDAAGSEEGTRQLSKEIFGNEKVLLRKTLEDLLKDLTRNLYKIRVSTLDSFFMKLVGNFMLELGLPDSWRIVDESYQKRLINQAIRTTFENTPKNVALHLMHLLFQGETSKSFQNQIFSLANNLLDILYQSKPDAWDQLSYCKKPDPQDLEKALEDLETVDLPKTKEGKVNTNFQKAIQKIQEVALNGNWEILIDSKIHLSVLNKTFCYYKIDFSDYTPLIQILETINRQIRSSVINLLVDKTRATRSILDQIGTFLRTLKFHEGAYRFSDFPLLLEGKIPADQIVHRLDTKTEHLLLDEFQDTSPIQWRIIEPFAHMILSPNQRAGDHTSFFCVGDMKQAIYGWRGGVAEILEYVEKLPNIDPSAPLLSNWRSSPIIIGTVNQIFRHLQSNAVLNGSLRKERYENQEILNKTISSWADQFKEHQSSPKTKDLKGYCSLEVAPLYLEGDLDRGEVKKYLDIGYCGSGEGSNSEEDHSLQGSSGQQQLTLGYSVSRIIELHKEHPNATIGVLARNNVIIGKIVSLLRKNGIECSEEGGTLLADAASVEAILSFLKIADHPGDTISLFHLASIKQFSDYFGITENNYNDRETGEKLSSLIRNKILSEGLSRVVNALAGMITPCCNSREKERLNKLVELACQQEEKGIIRIDTFVEIVRATKIETPSASKIRIMTIHGSKGLEFDIVVLPQLDQSIIPRSETVITHSPTITERFDTVFCWANQEMIPWLPNAFGKYIDLYQQNKMEEELCNLYVALTRAARQLVMIVSPEESEAKGEANHTPPKKDQKKSSSKKNEPYSKHTCANILRAALVRSDTNDQPKDPFFHSVIWSSGDLNWDTKSGVPQSPSEPKKEEDRPYPIIGEDRITDLFDDSSTDPELREDHAPSWKSGRQWIDPHIFAYGTAIHLCFEQIEWLEKSLPNRDTLRSLLAPILFHAELIETTINHFYTMCKNPVTQKALSLSEYHKPGPTPVHCPADLRQPRWIVERERPFAETGKNGSLSRGILDRLVLLRDEKKILGADIIDFKTDRLFDPQGNLINPESGKTLFEHYQDQLGEYAKRISRWYSLDQSQISQRLLFVSCDQIVDVNHGKYPHICSTELE